MSGSHVGSRGPLSREQSLSGAKFLTSSPHLERRVGEAVAELAERAGLRPKAGYAILRAVVGKSSKSRVPRRFYMNRSRGASWEVL